MHHCVSRLRPIALLLGLSAATAAAAPADETRHDEAALRAIADHWENAELDGDVDYLSQLLAADYRSIGGTGETTTRAAILGRAEQAHRSPAAAAEGRRTAEAYLREHPTATAVAIHGTLGIVSYYDPKRGLEHSVRGSDIFVYEGNRWRAAYSVHTRPSEAP
jgi:hypothetical protein